MTRQAPEPFKVALRDLEASRVDDDELHMVKQGVVDCFNALFPEAVEASPSPDAIPPMPESLGKNSATRAGWVAYFEGENDDQCGFPRSRSDLHREWQRGWRAANKSVVRPERTPEPSSKPCQLDGEVDAALAKLETVIEFLMGEGPMKGRSFGDRYDHLGPFWWRTDLREARDDLLKAMRPESWAELTPPL